MPMPKGKFETFLNQNKRRDPVFGRGFENWKTRRDQWRANGVKSPFVVAGPHFLVHKPPRPTMYEIERQLRRFVTLLVTLPNISRLTGYDFLPENFTDCTGRLESAMRKVEQRKGHPPHCRAPKKGFHRLSQTSTDSEDFAGNRPIQNCGLNTILVYL
ncbi:hypothetical protein C8R44DRAFT_725332 [Mycena epipterygia]|nr:hypothetical protein C8R44DRAFT_725332 [Mycena epipterygia]